MTNTIFFCNSHKENGHFFLPETRSKYIFQQKVFLIALHDYEMLQKVINVGQFAKHPNTITTRERQTSELLVVSISGAEAAAGSLL